MATRQQIERLAQRIEGLAQRSDGRPVYVWRDLGETADRRWSATIPTGREAAPLLEGLKGLAQYQAWAQDQLLLYWCNPKPRSARLALRGVANVLAVDGARGVRGIDRLPLIRDAADAPTVGMRLPHAGADRPQTCWNCPQVSCPFTTSVQSLSLVARSVFVSVEAR